MATQTYELLELERTGHIATITLNRPDRLNALNPQLVADFHAVLDEIAEDLEIRAVVVTGAGRGFCSGADVARQLESLQERRRLPPRDQASRRWPRICSAFPSR